MGAILAVVGLLGSEVVLRLVGGISMEVKGDRSWVMMGAVEGGDMLRESKVG
jgi:hypothetical protein